jgi:hypothetical protein
MAAVLPGKLWSSGHSTFWTTPFALYWGDLFPGGTPRPSGVQRLPQGHQLHLGPEVSAGRWDQDHRPGERHDLPSPSPAPCLTFPGTQPAQRGPGPLPRGRRGGGKTLWEEAAVPLCPRGQLEPCFCGLARPRPSPDPRGT